MKAEVVAPEVVTELAKPPTADEPADPPPSAAEGCAVEAPPEGPSVHLQETLAALGALETRWQELIEVTAAIERTGQWREGTGRGVVWWW